MKKINFKFPTFVLVILLSMGLFTSCNNSKLSDDFKKEEVQEKAEDIIFMLKDRDSEGILNISTAQLSEALTDETFKGLFDILDEGGDFKEIDNINIKSHKDKETNQEFAVVTARVKYANRDFTYTISFNKNMQLAGIFIK